MSELGQQLKQSILQSILSGAEQPTAQLQETQAAAGAAGASAANSMSEVSARSQQLAQQQFLKDTQTLFNKNKDKSGYISPDLYNQVKETAPSLGISGDTFDQTFGKGGYVDPQHEIEYNTAEGLSAQKQFGDVKRSIQNLVTQYNAVPDAQKGLFSKAQLEGIPFLGQLLAPSAVNYEAQRSGLISNLRSLASEQQGSGVRIGPQLIGRLENLLPSTKNATTVNHKNIESLDSDLKSAFNTKVGLDPQFLPSKGRPPLSSFGQ